MSWTYREALEYLYSLQKYGIKFGLSKTSNLMKAFGNPHLGNRYIHIAGSNGKGSVAAMVESILVRSGLKVGFYSSPHLVRFTERFRINQEEISQEKAAGLTRELKDTIDPRHPPTFFEVATAMALVYFAREKTDIAIMEVGMGGRLDATNVIRPEVSVITNISLEHQFFLGSSLMQIAGEKAGIIKKGVHVITAATRPHVIRLFESLSAEKKAPFFRVGRDIRYRSREKGLNYYGIKRVFRDLEYSLHGSYQNRNCALALGIIELLEMKGFGVSTRNILDGLKNTTWPGRMHIVSRNPLTILDGAHNPGAVRKLAGAVRADFSYDRLFLVLGVMEDKDIDEMLRIILPVSDYVICTRPDYYRSADPEDLMRRASLHGKKGKVIPTVGNAVEEAGKMASPGDAVLVTGSLFTVGEALTYFDPVAYRPDEV